jgi:hypothetical protein
VQRLGVSKDWSAVLGCLKLKLKAPEAFQTLETYTLNGMASQPREAGSSATLLRVPQISPSGLQLHEAQSLLQY